MPALIGARRQALFGRTFSLDTFMAAQSAGLYYDFTKTDRHFQENVGPTLADDVGEAIGLALDQRQWSGQTLAQVVAAASELNTSIWTDRSSGTGSSAYSNGTVTLTGVDGANRGAMDTPITTVVGKSYRVAINIASAPGVMNFKVCAATAGGSPIASNNSIGVGASSIIFTATGTTTYIYLQTGIVAGAHIINSVTAKLIPGIPGIQATGTLKPIRQTTGAKFDGTDDNLLTSYLAGAGANFIVALVTVPASLAGTQILSGSAEVGTNRFRVSFDTSGRCCGSVGTQIETTIVGAIDRRSQDVVVGISCDGSTVRLLDDNAIAYEAAQSGAPSTTIAFRVGALNSNGAASNPFGGSVKKLVAGREFLTLSRYLQIRNALLAA